MVFVPEASGGGKKRRRREDRDAEGDDRGGVWEKVPFPGKGPERGLCPSPDIKIFLHEMVHLHALLGLMCLSAISTLQPYSSEEDQMRFTQGRLNQVQLEGIPKSSGQDTCPRQIPPWASAEKLAM